MGGGGDGVRWSQSLSWLETDRSPREAPPPLVELYEAISCILGTFTVQFIYEKRYIYYHLSRHLELFVNRFLLLHTEIEETFGKWMDYWGTKGYVGPL